MKKRNQKTAKTGSVNQIPEDADEYSGRRARGFPAAAYIYACRSRKEYWQIRSPPQQLFMLLFGHVLPGQGQRMVTVHALDAWTGPKNGYCSRT